VSKNCVMIFLSQGTMDGSFRAARRGVQTDNAKQVYLFPKPFPLATVYIFESGTAKDRLATGVLRAEVTKFVVSVRAKQF